MSLDRFQNPFSPPPGCNTCSDTRHVSARDYSSTPCPVCGCHCPRRGKGEPPPEPCSGCRKSRDLKRDAFRRFHAAPTICELDLTPAEFAVYRQMRADHPAASKLTVLAWLEGQRFDPSKDPTFLAECTGALEAWREATGRNLPESAGPSLAESHPVPNPASPSPDRASEPTDAPPPDPVVRNGLPGAEKGQSAAFSTDCNLSAHVEADRVILAHPEPAEDDPCPL